MKRALLGLMLTLTAATTAHAGQLVDVTVRDRDDGETLRLYQDGGRYYVAGEPGHRYSVTLRNNSGERVMAVLSVDGVNAISGQTASAQQSGYVLNPWQQTEIKGWRKSLDETAEFYFTALPDSYAARTGRPQNVGVIGVAVYRERQQPVYRQDDDEIAQSPRAERGREYDKSAGDSAASAPSPGVANESKAYGGRAAAPQRQQDLGTGHGERRYDPARYTTFERRSARPDEVITLYYDGYAALVDRGVIPQQRWSRNRDPQPFPNGFAPDPRW